ncbi:putative B-cell lymphoma 6 protein [Quillaja saponaria]|uniref:B-cell lymphoma 6 protein n=1 Tax=Quillaja saponaria TaxID=32244 RepID=A0AAD7KWI1_QUISA|nr:putative B-cell lymphoma 6 protein [Quillaja saponaria]
MARLSILLLIFLVVFSSLQSCLEGRKLLGMEQNTKAVPSSSRQRLLLTTVPSSTPTKKGHATIVNEILIARHLSSTIDRILRSVPSPGAGHR